MTSQEKKPSGVKSGDLGGHPVNTICCVLTGFPFYSLEIFTLVKDVEVVDTFLMLDYDQ